MTIKKFQGKTKEEAIAIAKAEMGDAVVIMNVKEVKGKGLLHFFAKSTYEVTAAIEDDNLNKPSFDMRIQDEKEAPRKGFQAVADEEIVIPPLQEEELLKDAFAAVNQVILQKEEFKPLAETHFVKEASEIADSKHNTTAYQNLNVSDLQPTTTVHESVLESKNDQEALTNQQSFFKMMYKVLMENEVNEKYINQLVNDVERVTHSTDGLQFLISNAYQKMILKLGQPYTISFSKKKPKVVFFIGPTGVGKTTTIAKIASKYKVEQDKKIALITADTYRIAATDQLRTYANILETPLSIVYSPEDLLSEITRYEDYDLILVDTAGFSHKNEQQREDMENLLSALPEEYEQEIYLVLSVTTKYKDLIEITDSYQSFCKFALIFTKLDETSALGNIYNIRMYTQAPLSYVTTGQNVPDDMEELDTQKLVKQLLGGK